MSDRDEIVELTSELGLLIDARDWDAALALSASGSTSTAPR